MKHLLCVVLGIGTLAGLALTPKTAQAECKAAYTADALLGDIQVMAGALRAKDAFSLKTTGASLQAGLVCLREPMPAALYATVYRLLGVAAFENADPEGAQRWFFVARELDPTHEWDILDIAPGTPLFDAYMAARAGESSKPVSVEGMEMSAPAGSELLIDGRPLLEAAATMERYHLIQQVSDSGGQVRASWLILGNAFPSQLMRSVSLASQKEQKEQEEALVDEQEGRRSRKEAEVLAGGYTTDEVTVVGRERPSAKVPLLAAGALGMLAAGGIYAASYASNQQFQGATTTDDLLAAQQLTNTLVIASGGALLMGAGVGVWGVIIDDTPTAGLTVSW